MKITIKKDFRTFKAGDVFDFSELKTLRDIVLVGDNGCGKSSLIHALRGYKNDHKTNSLYNSDFDELAKNIEVEHEYEKIFYLDNVKDNGTDFKVAWDASQFLSSGGFQAQKLSHGQGTLTYLTKFISEYENRIVSGKTLLVFDEIDNGLSLKNMALFRNLVVNLCFKHKCHILIISHNPFLISQSFMCYDISKKDYVSSSNYILEQTGFELKNTK